MKAEATSGGVRKGAWSHQEDNLLRQCIEKYGEGKWHQVPVRAGLNRCRKSCRLRWLNYLKPDIKRGEFGADEVDLLLRLHKLLGNRWSLIAGRIPGRTANDVKNYWNTHQQKKMMPKSQEKTKPEDINQDDDHLVLTKTTVFKPRARTFSKDPPRCSTGQIAPASSVSIHPSQDGSGSDIPAPQLAAADDGSQWWDDLFGDQMKDIGRNKEEDHEPIEPTFWADQLLTAQLLDENSVQAGPNDFWVDMDFF